MPFPSSNRKKSGKSTTTIQVYCVCQMIDDGTKMIECAGCKEWYHLACIEVEKFVANKKLHWFCTNQVHSQDYVEGGSNVYVCARKRARENFARLCPL